jgi:AraC family transcriptional regulator, regulatory protein of adaptative response / DNA-3-methyladenine glycosylase II
MLSLDDTAAYQVITARDARFDGRLFVGVTSTGVYCRPICRVRTPMRKNCRFFATPAQAEAASFRPCLKCRPELAPGAALSWTVMDASRTLARQAANLLDEQAASGDARSLVDVAARLGVSDRHLRRIFQTEHGVTPLQYLQTRRLLLAKQLLTDTRLPVAQIALASGFNSLRRFNAAFADSYRMSPSRLRGEIEFDALAIDAAVTVKLAYRAPYDVEAFLRFIARRAIPDVEAVNGRRVRRSLRAGAATLKAGWVEVEFAVDAPIVHLRYAPELASVSGRIVATVRRWLDLDAMPEAIDSTLAALPGAPGLRLPGSTDAFELAVRAVLGQQVTVTAARTLGQRVVERFGSPLSTPWPEVSRSFPQPIALATTPFERLAELGIIRSRAAAIIEIAQAWDELAPLVASRARPEPLIARLCAIKGIGPWTAHYIAMRALGWPDAFPPNDVAVLKALSQLFGTTSQRAADIRAQAWQPWRSYAVLRLWNTLEPMSPRPGETTPLRRATQKAMAASTLENMR